jgi:antitoxin ParD1/3/4
MPTRNVVLTDSQSEFIDRMVEQGNYQNASELMREALRQLQRSEEVWEKAKAGVLEGLEQIRRGETVDGEEAFARIMAKHFGRK